jgi:hypothetical protein
MNSDKGCIGGVQDDWSRQSDSCLILRMGKGTTNWR